MVLVTTVTRNRGRLKKNLKELFPSELVLDPIPDSHINDYLKKNFKESESEEEVSSDKNEKNDTIEMRKNITKVRTNCYFNSKLQIRSVLFWNIFDGIFFLTSEIISLVSYHTANRVLYIFEITSLSTYLYLFRQVVNNLSVEGGSGVSGVILKSIIDEVCIKKQIMIMSYIVIFLFFCFYNQCFRTTLSLTRSLGLILHFPPFTSRTLRLSLFIPNHFPLFLCVSISLFIPWLLSSSPCLSLTPLPSPFISLSLFGRQQFTTPREREARSGLKSVI